MHGEQHRRSLWKKCEGLDIYLTDEKKISEFEAHSLLQVDKVSKLFPNFSILLGPGSHSHYLKIHGKKYYEIRITGSWVRNQSTQPF